MVVVPELSWVSVVPGRRCLHGIGRVTGFGKSKGTKRKSPRWGGGMQWGSLNVFVKTGDPSDVVIVVVVVFCC